MTQGSPQKSLAQEMAATVADLYMLAGTDIRVPHPISHAVGNGDQVKLGICIAAHYMQQAMSKRPELSAAFADHLYKPALDDVQGK
jgi:hypothetical protein